MVRNGAAALRTGRAMPTIRFMDIRPIDPTRTAPANQLVTASDLVRHFGLWQDRAVRAPVYVVHRGRPRLVLTSVELMDALCAPHGGAGGAAQPLSADALLRATRDAVVAVDGDGRVTAANAAARDLLGGTLDAGTELATAWPSPDDFVAAAAARVAASGVAERLDVAGRRGTGQRLSADIVPLDRGAVLLARDVTAEERARDLEAQQNALATALSASGAAAAANISLRGYVEPPAAGLSALCGLDAAALSASRFTSLLDVRSRAAAGEALEHALGGEASALDVRLLVNRGDPMPARLAFAPRRRGAVVEGATALLMARGGAA